MSIGRWLGRGHRAEEHERAESGTERSAHQASLATAMDVRNGSATDAGRLATEGAVEFTVGFQRGRRRSICHPPYRKTLARRALRLQKTWKTRSLSDVKAAPARPGT